MLRRTDQFASVASALSLCLLLVWDSSNGDRSLADWAGGPSGLALRDHWVLTTGRLWLASSLAAGFRSGHRAATAQGALHEPHADDRLGPLDGLLGERLAAPHCPVDRGPPTRAQPKVARSAARARGSAPLRSDLLPPVEGVADWIIRFIEKHGYGGIAALMLLENVVPPIPSELIMPFAGFAAARGDLNPILVAVAGAAGSLLGSLPWYLIGRAIGLKRLRSWTSRHGRWLGIQPDELDRAQIWFDKRGRVAVLIGRLVPGLRSLISAPAGIARMPFATYFAWSFLGSIAWAGLLTGVGFAMGERYGSIGRTIDVFAKAVLTIAVALYLWRVVTYRSRHRAGNRTEGRDS